MTDSADPVLHALTFQPPGSMRLREFLETTALEITLWVIAGVLVIRCLRWFANRYAARIEEKFDSSDLIVQTEDAKHRRALVDVVTWSLVVGVVIVVLIRALVAFDVPLAGLAGPGAVLGAALGFGAQRVVQDILAGFFIVAEKQYGYGDVVALSVSIGDAEGTVEDVSLRMTRLRTAEGEVITVPNGQIVKATNLSKDWARSVVDVPVPAEADIGLANEVLDEVGQEFYNSSRWHNLLLDAPSSLGVIDLELDAITLRVVARTLPGKQFDVSRALRVQIVRALARRGITVAAQDVQAAGAPPATLAENAPNREQSDDE